MADNPEELTTAECEQIIGRSLVHHISVQGATITDLRKAIEYTLSNDFPAPQDAASRLAWLAAWWQGEQLRINGIRDHVRGQIEAARKRSES